MVYTPIDVKKEQAAFQQEVEELKRWWASPRFRKTKRYTSPLRNVLINPLRNSIDGIDRILLRVLSRNEAF
jgi:hypothetical protein